MSDSPAKDEIRRRMREKRHEVTVEKRMTAGKIICKNLMGDAVRLMLTTWRACVYLSTLHEIPTRYIVRAFWEAGREVCVPAWSKSSECYKLYAFDPRMKLIKGHHGIHEPAVRIPVSPWDVNAFILPGLAFDSRGGRLGFGAGHYDGILSQAVKKTPKIALCFDWQVVDDLLPQEEHDIPMDWIITDQRVINCAANRTSSETPGKV